MDPEFKSRAYRRHNIYVLLVRLLTCKAVSNPNCTDCDADIHVASFFSIHRPISVTTSVPPPSSDFTFSSIFSARERPKHQPQDVIYTVSSAIDNIEDVTAQSQSQQLSQEESDLRDAVTQSSVSNAEMADTQHLDGAQPQTIHINIQELAKSFQPFKAPPAPVPMDQAHLPGVIAQQSPQAKRKTVRKSFSTRLLITENIHPNGHTTYETRASPLVEELAGEHLEHVKLPPTSRQPFLKRMLERQRRLSEWRDGGDRKEVWRAISVKRQRKLKMKKHKYKKLMRRTRNLRRKLDKN